MILQKTKWWGGLLLISLPLAFGAWLVGFPAAFLVGAMVGAIVYSLTVATKVRVPRPVFVCVQAVLGCAVARAITSSFLDSVTRSGAIMLLVVLATIMAGALVGWVLVRYGALPGTTAAWGSSPGGASAMVAMAEEYGADTRLVAFMQYLRVVMVVLTATLVSQFLLGATAASSSAPSFSSLFAATPLVPTLQTLGIAVAGGLLGKWSRIPSGALLVTMLLGGVLHAMGVDIVLPAWLLALANVALGWYVGLGFDRSILRYVFKAIPQLLLSTFLLIGMCGFSSWVLTRFVGLDPLTAFLATSPGGLDSVVVIALGSKVDFSFIVAVQTLRLFMVILIGPFIAKWLCRFARSPSAH
ncbi:AbrB family transcriptional regulator [Formivibrio citricus]|nr:AbrB family transcriptional regulator [Formivibrio citricus]